MTHRLIQAAVVVGLLLQVSGVARAALSLLDQGQCSSCTDDDADGGECPPACPTCTCTHAPRPVVASTHLDVSEPIVDQTRAPKVRHSSPHASPDPQRIFHPPRH